MNIFHYSKSCSMEETDKCLQVYINWRVCNFLEQIAVLLVPSVFYGAHLRKVCVCVFGKLNVGGYPVCHPYKPLETKQFSLQCQLVFQVHFLKHTDIICTDTISFTLFCTDYTYMCHVCLVINSHF